MKLWVEEVLPKSILAWFHCSERCSRMPMLSGKGAEGNLLPIVYLNIWIIFSVSHLFWIIVSLYHVHVAHDVTNRLWLKLISFLVCRYKLEYIFLILPCQPGFVAFAISPDLIISEDKLKWFFICDIQTEMKHINQVPHSLLKSFSFTFYSKQCGFCVLFLCFFGGTMVCNKYISQMLL